MGLNSSNILLIDDDERFLEATNMIFNRHDFLIKGVTNGKAGIEVLKKQYFDYDMIFVDLDLPEMDGIEIFKAIRKINTKIPILFVSAHFGEYKWEQKLKTLGVKIMRIEKPFPIVTSKDFLDIKRTLIEERDRYREELFYPFKFSLAEFMDLALMPLTN
jgi:DNA-binding NtrC family response regulator